MQNKSNLTAIAALLASQGFALRMAPTAKEQARSFNQPTSADLERVQKAAAKRQRKAEKRQRKAEKRQNS